MSLSIFYFHSLSSCCLEYNCASCLPPFHHRNTGEAEAFHFHSHKFLFYHTIPTMMTNTSITNPNLQGTNKSNGSLPSKRSKSTSSAANISASSPVLVLLLLPSPHRLLFLAGGVLLLIWQVFFRRLQGGAIMRMTTRLLLRWWTSTMKHPIRWFGLVPIVLLFVGHTSWSSTNMTILIWQHILNAFCMQRESVEDRIIPPAEWKGICSLSISTSIA